MHYNESNQPGESDYASQAIHAYLRLFEQYPRLTVKQEQELIDCIRKAGNNERVLRRFLAKGTLFLIPRVILRNRFPPTMDILHEGVLTLFEVAQEFKPWQKQPFRVFATARIRQAMEEMAIHHRVSWLLPREAKGIVSTFQKITHHLFFELGWDALDEEMISLAGLRENQSLGLLEMLRNPLSLDELLDGDGDEQEDEGWRYEDEAGPVSHLPIISDPVFFSDGDSYSEYRSVLAQALAMLPRRMRQVIELRFGLIEDQEYTLDEIGKRLGVTRERVRQMEHSAIIRLRGLLRQIARGL